MAADEPRTLNVPYTVCEVLVAACAVVGNALVILAFRRDRRLRRRTNYYIVSLAAADLLVGLIGIPAAVLASVGLPRNLHFCLFTVSLLVVLCTISIFCLVAVSVDRYWAILHPMGYSRNVRTKTAICIIGLCWASGTLVGFLPLLGWHAAVPTDAQCLFEKVMDYNYLVFLYFATIIFPALLLAAFYAHIYRVVLKQVRQMVTMNPDTGSCFSRHVGGAGTMLQVLGAARKREVKATQILSIIVLFFIICWVPLYTINFIQAVCSDCHVNETVTYIGIILSHLNSAGNPLLYAYHLRDFRAALKQFLCGLLGIAGNEGTAANGQGGRTQFGSQSALQQHATRNDSVQSLGAISWRHNRNSFPCDKFRHISSDITIARDAYPVLADRAGPVATALNGMCKAATLPMTAGVTMWTLAEAPSGVEDDRSSPGPDDGGTPLGGVRRRTASADGDSGKVNSAYISDVSLYMEDDGSTAPAGEDEVFAGPCAPAAGDESDGAGAEGESTPRPHKTSVGNGSLQSCGGVKLSPLKLVGELFSSVNTQEGSSSGSNTSLICEGEAQKKLATAAH